MGRCRHLPGCCPYCDPCRFSACGTLAAPLVSQAGPSGEILALPRRAALPTIRPVRAFARLAPAPTRAHARSRLATSSLPPCTSVLQARPVEDDEALGARKCRERTPPRLPGHGPAKADGLSTGVPGSAGRRHDHPDVKDQVAKLIKQRVPGVDNVVGRFQEGVDHPLRRVAICHKRLPMSRRQEGRLVRPSGPAPTTPARSHPRATSRQRRCWADLDDPCRLHLVSR